MPMPSIFLRPEPVAPREPEPGVLPDFGFDEMALAALAHKSLVQASTQPDGARRFLLTGRIGSITAVYVLEQHGTQRHTYTRWQIANRYRELYGDNDMLDDFISYTREL